jgi:dihydropteroate synthase/2-amino-4-hydroxy-6-hydroxymethyldihydropteridine diphosphokinase
MRGGGCGSSTATPMISSDRANSSRAGSSELDQTSSSYIHDSKRNWHGKKQNRVYLAVGSNLGDRYRNIYSGLSLLCDPGYRAAGDWNGDGTAEESSQSDATRWVASSFLYHTAPMYVTDQPAFLNGVVEIETDLDPKSLLRRLKSIERDMGRNLSPTEGPIRNGPRPLDLDIVLWYTRKTTGDGDVDVDPGDGHDDVGSTNRKRSYEEDVPLIMDTPDLIIPHPRLHEREFVLAPLLDVASRRRSTSDVQGDSMIHPVLSNDTSVVTMRDLLNELIAKDDANSTSSSEGDDSASVPPTSRFIPLPRGRHILFSPHQSETLIMGILNVTPDSFSDGGRHNTSVEDAVQHAVQMIQDGAHIIDIGGESTRPGAAATSVEMQIQRTVPVIAAIRKLDSNVILSIDTRSADVARAAVAAGADIVNDVSSGTFDLEMLTTVAELQVPIVLMHMRGTPETMQSLTQYGDGRGGVVEAVIDALLERSQAAEEAGIPRWMQVLDPGIGFAKDLDGNLSLLKHLSTKVRTELGDFPILLGTSRKGFIGKLTGETVTEERDFGTLGSSMAALCLGRAPYCDASRRHRSTSLGYNILRVHNVKAAKHATVVMDAIVNAR